MNKAALLILDGWGLGQIPEADAIRQAHTPVMDQMMSGGGYSTLTTFGEQVGLPGGQMGNSEVGHMNIGAGRIIYQDLLRINRDIASGAFFQRPALERIFDQAKVSGRKLHLIGLLSDGGVHSHINHLLALIDHAIQHDLKEVYIHAFLDGRDTDPLGGKDYVDRLLRHIAGTPVRLASIIGRYFAMDRDHRWDRTYQAYQLLVNGVGERSTDPLDFIRHRYEKGKTDEFMDALLVDENGLITEDDAVLWFNFRSDRPRQLTRMLALEPVQEVASQPLPLHMASMTPYDESFITVQTIYDRNPLEKTFGHLLEENGLTQLRAAETEKYPHVTYFFSGGKEDVFAGEKRILVDSPKVATYDHKPSMSARELTDAVLGHLRVEQPDFICLNFANTDMVGHTGVFAAAREAAEVVDECVGRILEVIQPLGYHCLLIADHGNADLMIHADGSPHTAHTINPVPCIYLLPTSMRGEKIRNGVLADIAVTLCSIMNLKPYEEMTGKNLLAT